MNNAVLAETVSHDLTPHPICKYRGGPVKEQPDHLTSQEALFEAILLSPVLLEPSTEEYDYLPHDNEYVLHLALTASGQLPPYIRKPFWQGQGFCLEIFCHHFCIKKENFAPRVWETVPTRAFALLLLIQMFPQLEVSAALCRKESLANFVQEGQESVRVVYLDAQAIEDTPPEKN
jgi:hypothetical protein